MLRKTNKQNPSSLKPGLEKRDSALPAMVSKGCSVQIACPTLCDPMGYTVPGILQGRILEWVAYPFSRGSSQPRSPALQADSFPAEPQGKSKNTGVGCHSLIELGSPALQVDSLPTELSGKLETADETNVIDSANKRRPK